MVNTTTVYIGVAASPTQWVTGGWNAILTAVIGVIEESGLDVRINTYYVLTPEQMASAASTFLTQTRFYTRRAFIAGSGSADLLAAEAVLKVSRVPVFSMGASASRIISSTKVTTAMSYAPADRNAVMFLFVMHYLYARQHVYVIYDHEDEARRVFIDSYLEDVRRQAAVFGLTVCVQTIETTAVLPDNSTILLLASNAALAAMGSARLDCTIPNSSFTILTDINAGARASYFGANVVPLCMMMYALDYTAQTRTVTSLFTREQLKTVSPYIFALYDCLVNLAKFSETLVSLTISNFVTFNVTLPLVPFYAYMPNKYLCPKVRSPCFCRYSLCYLRQQLLQDPALYLARFVGGTPLFPDAYGSLFQFGFFRNATQFALEQNRFLRMVQSGGALVMEKFDVVDVDLTASGPQPPSLLAPVQTGQTQLMGVQLAKDAASGVPLYIERLQIYSGPVAMSQTMGKVVEQYEVTPACRT